MKKDAVAGPVIEIMTITLKPGTRDAFHRLYVEEALPLLRKWHFTVIAHGPSLHDENSYYIIRSFKSLDDRRESEDAYYGSDDWQKGPRKRILALFEHDSYIVISLDELTNWTVP